MKPEQYNPRAKEAFAKSLIDIGVTVFKSIILLITVVPLAALIKGTIGGAKEISVFQILGSLSHTTLSAISVLLAVGFFVGHYLRKEGLRHLHELEENT